MLLKKIGKQFSENDISAKHTDTYMGVDLIKNTCTRCFSVSIYAFAFVGMYVELERLRHSAENRWKVVSSNRASPSVNRKTLSRPTVNGYLLRVMEGLGTERRSVGSAFHMLYPRYMGL